MAIEEKRVPSVALMENAGRSVADHVSALLEKKKEACVCVLCGLGNNAGDGFVAARHLWNAEMNVSVFLLGPSDKLKNDARINYEILKRCHYPVKEIFRLTPTLKTVLAKADVVVDAIFGVGLNRDIEGLFRSCIALVNDLRCQVVAVDIPSGLDGTTGHIYQVCIKAKRTVTFSAPKAGFYRQEGPRYVGDVVTVDIGIPRKLFKGRKK